MQRQERYANLMQYPQKIKHHEGPRHVVIGDLHGNALKLIYTLIEEGILEISEEDYENLKNIYFRAQDDRETLLKNQQFIFFFKGIIDSAQVNKNIGLTLIGDDLCDRGASDLLTLIVEEKLDKELEDFDSTLSNHTWEFLRLFFKNLSAGRNVIYDTLIKNEKLVLNSFQSLCDLLNKEMIFFNKPVSHFLNIGNDEEEESEASQENDENEEEEESEASQENEEEESEASQENVVSEAHEESEEAITINSIDAMVRNLIPRMKLFSYDLSPGGDFSLYSHAPCGLETIKLFCEYFKIPYQDQSQQTLALTIDAVNISFSSLLLNDFFLLDRITKSRKKFPNLDSEAILLWTAFNRVLWNHGEKKNLFELPFEKIETVPSGKFTIKLGHGHIGQNENMPSSLDNDLGKTINFTETSSYSNNKSNNLFEIKHYIGHSTGFTREQILNKKNNHLELNKLYQPIIDKKINQLKTLCKETLEKCAGQNKELSQKLKTLLANFEEVYKIDYQLSPHAFKNSLQFILKYSNEQILELMHFFPVSNNQIFQPQNDFLKFNKKWKDSLEGIIKTVSVCQQQIFVYDVRFLLHFVTNLRKELTFNELPKSLKVNLIDLENHLKSKIDFADYERSMQAVSEKIAPLLKDMKSFIETCPLEIKQNVDLYTSKLVELGEHFAPQAPQESQELIINHNKNDNQMI